ncbi:MAG TPA: NAD(P)/FAD-dependent oxidoreductase [Oscillatoriaceae cyanobacterium]
MPDSDVIVVGAGPAGSALAAWLGERGRRVLLLERARFPRDKVCGECLNPGARSLLAGLGLENALLAAGAAPFRGLRLVAPDGAIAELRYPHSAQGLTLPRTTLDALLAERARAVSGVTLVEHATVVALVRDGTVTGVRLSDGRALSARMVVAADGRFSALRRAYFGEAPPNPARRFCFLSTYDGGEAEDDLLECGVVASGVQYLRVYQGGGRYSICAVLDADAKTRHAPSTVEAFHRMALRWPRVAERIAQATPGPIKGMPLTPYAPPRLVGDGFALVGDAVGSLDPITGEGVFRALTSARLAAETIDRALSFPEPPSAERLAPYEAALRARFAPVTRFVDGVVRLTGAPAPTANLLVRALPRVPGLAPTIASVQGAMATPEVLLHPHRWLFGRHA